MIDRDGLFSPNATSRGEPDSDKLAYLSLRINGLAGDVDIRTLEKISFYAALVYDPIRTRVRESVQCKFATAGFGITKEGLPFALVVPMISFLSRNVGRDWSVRAVTMSEYWEHVSLNVVVEFSAGIPLSDEWKAEFPFMDEEGNLLESGRLRVYAFGDVIVANGFDGEIPCGFVSEEGELGYGKELTDSQLVDSREFKVYSDKQAYKDSITNGIERLSHYLRSSKAAYNRLTGADCCVYRIVASKKAPIVVTGFNSSNNGVCTVSDCADWINSSQNSLYNANIKVLDMQKSAVRRVQIYESRGDSLSLCLPESNYIGSFVFHELEVILVGQVCVRGFKATSCKVSGLSYVRYVDYDAFGLTPIKEGVDDEFERGLIFELIRVVGLEVIVIEGSSCLSETTHSQLLINNTDIKSLTVKLYGAVISMLRVSDCLYIESIDIDCDEVSLREIIGFVENCPRLQEIKIHVKRMPFVTYNTKGKWVGEEFIEKVYGEITADAMLLLTNEGLTKFTLTADSLVEFPSIRVKMPILRQTELSLSENLKEFVEVVRLE
jgi:hypothetical protein